MTIQPLIAEEKNRHNGASHVAILTYADLTATGNTQTVNLFAVPANVAVWLKEVELPVALVSSDATLVSTAATVGDGSSNTRFLASTEFNVAGTEIVIAGGALTAPYLYAAAGTVSAFFTATAAKALNTHTAGEIRFYFHIIPNPQNT